MIREPDGLYPGRVTKWSWMLHMWRSEILKAGDNSKPFVEGEEKVLQVGNVTSLGSNHERDGKTCASSVCDIVDFRSSSRACFFPNVRAGGRPL